MGCGVGVKSQGLDFGVEGFDFWSWGLGFEVQVFTPTLNPKIPNSGGVEAGVLVVVGIWALRAPKGFK